MGRAVPEEKGMEIPKDVYIYWHDILGESEEEHDELIAAGIDPEALGYMSGEERRKILKGVGLNPDDYDF